MVEAVYCLKLSMNEKVVPVVLCSSIFCLNLLQFYRDQRVTEVTKEIW